MRTIFMGNPIFAIPTLKAIHKSRHDLVAIVSNAPNPMGRGRSLKSTPVGQYAKDQSIKLLEPLSLKTDELKENLKTLNPDIFVVVAYKILPNSLIQLPKYGSINLHASLLPKYRGAGPIQWALMNGDKKTGVTIFQLKKEIDTGDILMQKEIGIRKDDDMLSLGMRLCKLGAHMVIDTMNQISNGSISKRKQNSGLISHAPKITKNMTIIDWRWNNNKIHNWIRGLSPNPGMVTIFKNKRLRIFKSCIVRGKASSPGSVIESSNSSLIVSTGEGLLSITELQIEGKKRMHVEKFLRGIDIKPGDILGT